MKKELTEWDKIVLALAERKDWLRAYQLERQFIHGQVIGSEADTRLYELFDKQVPDSGSTKRIIDKAEYTIETKKEGGARLWRAFLSKEAPPKPVYYTRHPLTGERITTEALRAL